MLNFQNEDRTGNILLKNGWKVELLIDDDGHLNIYTTNTDGSDVLETETGQGDGINGDQLAFRLTTQFIENEYVASMS
ncbi:MAG: hypothetical protein GY801_08040 [bacterium]|nr:hypothetical protein [bacterium]